MKTPRRTLAVLYVALGVLAALFLLPFYIIVRNAFSTQQWITAASWNWLPNAVNLDTLMRILGNENLGLLRSLGNSAVVTVLQTAATVVVSMMAGYALARFSNRAAKVILGLTLFTLMVPTTVTFIPSFVMVSSLGWISTFRGLIIPTLFSAFATYLFRQHYADFPVELEEAASIDGAGQWRTFWLVVAPNSMGMVAAVGTITFIGSWNAFLWPTLVGRDATRTVQVALSQFMTSQGVRYPELFMGTLVAVLPMLFVFLFLQRYLVQGLTTSGLR